VSGSTSPNDPAVTARLTELETTVVAQRVALEAERELRAAAEAERDRLREAYEALKIQVELAHRRLVIAKAERVDTTQLELEFAATLADLDKLAGLVEPETDATSDEGGAAGDRPKRRRRRRCDLHKVVGEERIELPDPIYEGKFERIGAEEETAKLKWRRGGLVRVVIARLKYRTTSPAVRMAGAIPSAADAPSAIGATEVAVASATMTAPEDATGSTIEVANTDAATSANASPVDVPPTQLAISSATPAATPEAAAQVLAAPVIGDQAADSNAAKPTIVTAAMPPQLLPGSYALPSLLAHIASDKFCDGLGVPAVNAKNRSILA
jgi:hypothetical protein